MALHEPLCPNLTGLMAASKGAVPKLDLRKQYKEFYLPSAEKVVLVDVPEFLFVTLDGVVEAGVRPGDSEEFRDSMAAMYRVGYALKFMSKLRPDDPIDFGVMAVEGLWSTESGAKFDFDWREPSRYTLLMMQPDHITSVMFEQAVADTREMQGSFAHTGRVGREGRSRRRCGRVDRMRCSDVRRVRAGRPHCAGDGHRGNRRHRHALRLGPRG